MLSSRMKPGKHAVSRADVRPGQIRDRSADALPKKTDRYRGQTSPAAAASNPEQRTTLSGSPRQRWSEACGQNYVGTVGTTNERYP